MAGGRRPGPQCADNDPIEIDDGTLCLAQMPPPGPLGFSLDERNQTATDTSKGDIEVAVAAIGRETGTQIGEVLRSRIPELIAILGDLRTTTIYPFVKWNTFALAPPTRRVSGMKDILDLLGLNFLPPSMNRGSAELIFVLTRDASRITPGGQDVRADKSDTPQGARAVGILVRLILQGIVRYVLAGSNRVRSAVAAWEARTNPVQPGAPSVTLSGVLARLQVSRFGETFSAWISQNWDVLLKNPRLRPEKYIGEGSIHTLASQFVTLKESNTPLAPTPAEDPPTFPSNTDMAAQAAALVAAAAEGVPFCPI